MAPQALTMRDLIWVLPPGVSQFHAFGVGLSASLCGAHDWARTREASFRVKPTHSDVTGRAAPVASQTCPTCRWLSGVDAGRKGLGT